MAATSVGQIGLDLVTNAKPFKKQMLGIQSLADKTGKALAAAFTIKKIVDFSAKCLELGSDLAEVQNVVDVTFPNMTAKVDKFAQSAAAAFGMSETMAKKYTGTYGAMAKSFGFTEEAAYSMSTELTKLAGDVASFYNTSQDEAYTKLKSVFTGETETLKELGVVMTQSALDAYALANGFGKATSAMTEQEKVALRYAFVQDKLSAAAGDFSRTSGSWANQVKLLQLQVESFMATVGQGLINLFTPIIKMINTIIGKLMSLANAFKAFTELITGKSSGGNAVTQAGTAAAESLDNATGSASNLANATKSAGDAAKSAAKKMRELMGFDKINKLTENTDSSSGGSGSGGISGDEYDFGELETGENILDETSSKFQAIIDKAKELAEIFKTGFELGIGDTEKNLERIQDACDTIRTTLQEIFTDPKVVEAANEMVDSIALNLGKLTGTTVNIGVSIATNLTEGLAECLDEKKDYITEKLSSILTIEASSLNIVGDFGATVGDIISGALTGEAGTKITSNIASILTTIFFGAFEQVQKIKLDIEEMVLTPVIENKEEIKRAIENTLEPIATGLEGLKAVVEDTFESIEELYDEHIAPLFDTLTEDFGEICGELTTAYNKHIAPVLDNLSRKFKEVCEEYIGPAIQKVVKAFGPLIDIVRTLWEKYLKPFVDWCIKYIAPVLVPIFETFGEASAEAFGAATDTIGDLFEYLQKIADIFDDILNADSFEDLMEIGEEILDLFGDVFDLANEINSLSSFSFSFEGIVDGTFTNAKELYEKIKDSKATKTISGKKTSTFDNIKEAWNVIKNSTVVKTISGIISRPFTDAKNTWDVLKNTTVVKTLSASVTTKFNSFKSSWDALKDKTITIKANVSAAITNIKELINTKLIAKLNSAITTLNKLPFVNVPKIPYLAQGGYVKKNTPQLAMIGDNRHQGEVVAPENKLLAMAREAASMSGGLNNAEAINLLKQILTLLQNLNLAASIDVEGLKKLIVRLINADTKARGECELII